MNEMDDLETEILRIIDLAFDRVRREENEACAQLLENFDGLDYDGVQWVPVFSSAIRARVK